MITQTAIDAEATTEKRHKECIAVLEYALPGAIGFSGGELTGFALTYDPYTVRIVLKASFEGKHMVSFHYGETMIGCLLAAFRAVKYNHVEWGVDKYLNK